MSKSLTHYKGVNMEYYTKRKNYTYIKVILAIVSIIVIFNILIVFFASVNIFLYILFLDFY